jgi:ribosomal protein S27E
MIRPHPFGRPSKPLRCEYCGNQDRTRLAIAKTVTLRRRRSFGDPNHRVLAEAVRVTCRDCGHQWHSTHKSAIAHRSATTSL